MERGFDVKISDELMDSLLSLYHLENAKPTVTTGRRSTLQELAQAQPLEGEEYQTFRTGVGKLIFVAPWRPDAQEAIMQLSTQVSCPTTESRRGLKHLLRYLKGTQTAVLQLYPTETTPEGVINLNGHSDSDWAGDAVTRCSVTGYSISLNGSLLLSKALKQKVKSLSSCEAEFYAASACAIELLGLKEFLQELGFRVVASLYMDSDSARSILKRRGPGGLKHIELRVLAIQDWVKDERIQIRRASSEENVADLFTKFLDGDRVAFLASRLGMCFEKQ